MATAPLIPVHVLGEDRIHLAPAHRGRLKKEQLKTVCGRLAISELSPFVMAGPKKDRCRVCFKDFVDAASDG